MLAAGRWRLPLKSEGARFLAEPCPFCPNFPKIRHRLPDSSFRSPASSRYYGFDSAIPRQSRRTSAARTFRRFEDFPGGSVCESRCRFSLEPRIALFVLEDFSSVERIMAREPALSRALFVCKSPRQCGNESLQIAASKPAHQRTRSIGHAAISGVMESRLNNSSSPGRIWPVVLS